METTLKGNIRMGYRRLDLTKINFSDESLTMEETLDGIEPYEWGGMHAGLCDEKNAMQATDDE